MRQHGGEEVVFVAQVRDQRMTRPRRLGLVAVVVVIAAVACTLAFWPTASGVMVERSAERRDNAQTVAATADAETVDGAAIVHIDGAVISPGVYELSGGSPRVRDAVEAAGGLAEDADTSSLNLAAPVTDGQKVYVARLGEALAEGASQGDAAGFSPSAESDGGLVNINSATTDELDSLPGVGPSTAAAIVEDREANGPFTSPEDLMRVSGIGEKKFAKLRDHICV